MTTRLKPIIYMPMEIASRELDSRLLLASLAVARGYEVVLGQKWLLEQNIRAMPPGLYLSKTLTQRDGVAMALAKSEGYVVAAIDEELPGLFMSAKQLRWMSADAVDAADLIFVAGNGNAAAVAERFPSAAKRIVQAANPRWDMLRPNLRRYYEVEAADLKQRYGPFILINTNFGFTNSEKGDADQIVREQERLGKLDMTNPEHVEYVKSIIKMERENRQAIEELLDVLPNRFPEHRIVLRPHPSESAETWEKIVAGRPRIDVIREGAAVAWILASDVLLHTNCTTGVEAMALDRPAICLMPSTSSANDRYLANRVNPVTRTIAEAVDLVDSLLSKDRTATIGHYSDSMRQQFEVAMSYEASKLGAETILDTIMKFVPPPQHPVQQGEPSQWSPGWLYRWRLRERSMRGRLIPNLDADDITMRTKRFSQLLQIPVPSRIVDIGSKILLLGNRELSRGISLRRSIGRYL
jgi:surface carbohydrate biosynthesis protein